MKPLKSAGAQGVRNLAALRNCAIIGAFAAGPHMKTAQRVQPVDGRPALGRRLGCMRSRIAENVKIM